MFWLGAVIGLLVGMFIGVFIGVFAMCVVSIHRVNEMGDVLDKCRRALSFCAFESGTAAAACNEAIKALKDQEWCSG